MATLFCRPTRGLRNNNPANIRHSSSRWIGLSDVQTDKEFCQFDDLKFGIRAFLVLCRTYYKKYGIRTIPQFLNRFAPLSSNEEHRQRYMTDETHTKKQHKRN